MRRWMVFSIVLMWLGSDRPACAVFGVDVGIEAFEGAAFPTNGWQTTGTNDNGSTYGVWDKAVSSNYVSGAAGFSGYAAGSVYGDYLLDTSLISPTFSTVGFNAVQLEFSGYFYFYSGYGNKCDLQYTTNSDLSWITFKTWDTYGDPAKESIALPDGALGQANVRLRWRRYTTSYPYYYAFVDNVLLHRAWNNGYQALGGNWRRLDWFGDYTPVGNEWIWHNRHGFMYAFPFSTPQCVWLYTMDMGWLWTSWTTYPYLFRFSDGVWLWYQPDSHDPRKFLNLSTGTWEHW